MTSVFMFCAIIGGTIFLVQFAMTIIGFGGEAFDFDMPDDFDPSEITDVQGDLFDHGSTAMFGIISFRTVVAAVTFFGMVGMAVSSAGHGPIVSLPLALVGGGSAMYGVYRLMRLLYSLKHDGTVRIGRTKGQVGKVYVPIPPKKTGVGKVQLRTSSRIMEYEAMTSATHKLPTGARVVVIGIVGHTTLEVEPIDESTEAT
jgi:hypothetical protein